MRCNLAVVKTDRKTVDCSSQPGRSPRKSAAQLVIEERERCARIAEALKNRPPQLALFGLATRYFWSLACEKIAEAILMDPSRH
ncbi:MAG: hypothetical protein JRJ12_09585 [Deltaproteobacteria bacterium]|nr:hypothetical protein [Deltaproteobacteria bacterium]MBW2072169.1 hypothetical protein [Deltaproteobacteria bacterium]